MSDVGTSDPLLVQTRGHLPQVSLAGVQKHNEVGEVKELTYVMNDDVGERKHQTRNSSRMRNEAIITGRTTQDGIEHIFRLSNIGSHWVDWLHRPRVRLICSSEKRVSGEIIVTSIRCSETVFGI